MRDQIEKFLSGHAHYLNIFRDADVREVTFLESSDDDPVWQVFDRLDQKRIITGSISACENVPIVPNIKFEVEGRGMVGDKTKL